MKTSCSNVAVETIIATAYLPIVALFLKIIEWNDLGSRGVNFVKEKSKRGAEFAKEESGKFIERKTVEC